VNQFELASLAWGPLVQSAVQHHLLTYQDLAQPLGLRGARPVRFALGSIQSLCLEKRLPPLTSIVINKHTRLPGLGFIARTGNLKEAHDSVFEFDWSFSSGAVSGDDADETTNCVFKAKRKA
jgi:putative restriction endonuclease